MNLPTLKANPHGCCQLSVLFWKKTSYTSLEKQSQHCKHEMRSCVNVCLCQFMFVPQVNLTRDNPVGDSGTENSLMRCPL